MFEDIKQAVRNTKPGEVRYLGRFLGRDVTFERLPPRSKRSEGLNINLGQVGAGLLIGYLLWKA